MTKTTVAKSYNKLDVDASRGARECLYAVSSPNGESTGAYFNNEGLVTSLNGLDDTQLTISEKPSAQEAFDETVGVLSACQEGGLDINARNAIIKARFKQSDESISEVILSQALAAGKILFPTNPFSFSIQHLYFKDDSWQFRYVYMSISCLIQDIHNSTTTFRRAKEQTVRLGLHNADFGNIFGPLVEEYLRKSDGQRSILPKHFFQEKNLSTQEMIDFVDHMATNTLSDQEVILRDELYERITELTGFEPVNVMVQEASSENEMVTINVHEFLASQSEHEDDIAQEAASVDDIIAENVHEAPVSLPWYIRVFNALKDLLQSVADWFTNTFGKKDIVKDGRNGPTSADNITDASIASGESRHPDTEISASNAPRP